MWNEYICVTSVEQALDILTERGPQARIVAGATDLILELERGVRRGITTLVDITRLQGQDFIYLDEKDEIHMGPLVTHNQCVASRLIVERAFPLAQAAWEVGAPQIRNRGTIAGNLITASPANDTITPLMALGARVLLRSARSSRVVPLEDFYLGVRRTVMSSDEFLAEIIIPAMAAEASGSFIKIGLRRAQAIAVVNAAVILHVSNQRITKATVTLGAVAPTIVHSTHAERELLKNRLDDTVIEMAAQAALDDSTPIGDVRGSADYRKEMVRVSVRRALRIVKDGKAGLGFPDDPVLLNKAIPLTQEYAHFNGNKNSVPIVTNINGKEYRFTSGHQKTLLRLLREDANLIGTKEGCAEGECGACTVIMDGMAVMSCLVPAPRAHGAVITTIEGLASDGQLHPVQQAFLDAGAVQCGYCTPGFIMSAAALLEERPHPSREDIRSAITGNLCRCTGYYKIVEAIEKSSRLA
jgi:xanthine dehydrogenase iron-sulfur cluster and FAD-binding subunit A